MADFCWVGTYRLPHSAHLKSTTFFEKSDPVIIIESREVHLTWAELARTAAFKQSSRDRKRVEMLFAHLKRILRLGRLRLRGPCGAQFEFTLAAIAQNLRRLAKLVARPPPIAPAYAA